MTEVNSVFPGTSVSIPVSGKGPVTVSISINGPSAMGPQPHGTATLEYYDPTKGQSVRETVMIGGNYQPTVVRVVTGSIFADEAWVGAIVVTPFDNPEHLTGIPGTITVPLGRVTGGLSNVTGYSITSFETPDGVPIPLGGGIQTNVSYPPGYLVSLGLDPNKLGSRYDPVFDASGNFVGVDVAGCFPADTPITLADCSTFPIEDIRLGDTVLAFDPTADLGRGALVPRQVVRLYRNTTTEWIKLNWDEAGETRELIATPGHNFLDQFGQFPAIETMLQAGRATVVLASGELAEVAAERIVYSAATAHLYERAEAAQAVGNAALKPAPIDAWATYNFEVEDLHTYVAGGVRVHNDSGIWGEIGNLFSSGENGTLIDHEGRIDRFNHTGVLDTIGDGISNVLHAVGEIFGAVFGTIKQGIIDLFSGAAFVTDPDNPPGYYEGMRIIENEHQPQGTVTVIGEDGRPQTVYVNGQLKNQKYQPGGDMNGDNTVNDIDRALHDQDMYERHADNARAEGNDWKADNFDRKAEEAREEYLDEKAKAKKDASTPILLDLDGDGVRIDEISRSNVFVDAGGEGLSHRSAWAAAGDGVLFYDPDGRNDITEKRQYVFTEWDPTATSDLAAVRAVFDSDGDGKLTALDADFAKFKVMVTNADGSRSAKTLTELGITEINLTADATHITLPDGSVITGQTSFAFGVDTRRMVA